MYIATRIYTGEGFSRESGFAVHYLTASNGTPGQGTNLGFIDSGQWGWGEILKALPGILSADSLQVTAREMKFRRGQTHTPAQMRRVADAIEGN